LYLSAFADELFDGAYRTLGGGVSSPYILARKTNPDVKKRGDDERSA